MKRDRVYNQLALACLFITVIVSLWYLLILIDPQSPLNPLPPIVRAVALQPTITPTPPATLPPTWTPTPLPTATAPRATATPTLTSTIRPSRTPVASPTPTLNPLIPTRSPYKFTASQPVLTADPYGAACGTWGGVGGQVFDVDGSPLTGVSIVGWGGPIPEQNKKVFVSGSDSHINRSYNSTSAYEIFIGAPGDFDFYVVVYENGRPASPVVKLRMVNDCNRDFGLVNFQRNHS